MPNVNLTGVTKIFKFQDPGIANKTKSDRISTLQCMENRKNIKLDLKAIILISKFRQNKKESELSPKLKHQKFVLFKLL